MAKAKIAPEIAPSNGVQNTDNQLPITNNQSYIEVIGARAHNLRNVDVRIPRNRLVVITGVSGSGKSSLAFDTIYAEGQRRFMETLSSYARQFIGEMERPDVEQITGLSPVISIEQKTTGRNPRSTVGTVTEVYDFLRLLFARERTTGASRAILRSAKRSEILWRICSSVYFTIFFPVT